jgi:hypothetical protein
MHDEKMYKLIGTYKDKETNIAFEHYRHEIGYANYKNAKEIFEQVIIPGISVKYGLDAKTTIFPETPETCSFLKLPEICKSPYIIQRQTWGYNEIFNA